MAMHFKLKDFGRTFATRERGAELRDVLVQRAHDGAEVTVDFDGVSNVSYSFADEFLGKLSGESDLRVRIENASARVQSIMDRAIARRATPAGR